MGKQNEANIINYNFIDNIRGIAMMCIVMEHSSLFWGLKFIPIDQQIVQALGLQIFKFGTILFFILAGFLLGDKFNTYSTKQYIGRRISNTLNPWLFWASFLLFLNYLQRYVRYLKSGDPTIFKPFWTDLWHEISFIIFQTSFWFILNFIICIAIILLFRRHLYKVRFGIILALCSLFYSINLYYKWIPTAHTTAMFGFVFYLWIGAMLNKHYEQFNNWISKIKMGPLLILFLILLAISCWEIMHLNNIGSDDPFNTLRISNILYSLVSFLVLFKLGNIKVISKLEPRKTTFGIYLIHQIFIFHLLIILFRIIPLRFDHSSAYVLLILQLIRFAVTYSFTYLLVILINKSKKMRWIIGQ